MPMEIVTMLGSTALGGLLKLWSQYQEGKKQERMQTQALLAQQIGDVQNARMYKNKPIQFTRRLIALTAVFSIILLPKLAAILGLDVTFGWTELKGGFWFLTDEKTQMIWKTAKGIVITPLDTNFLAAITGFYFGVGATDHGK